MLANSLFALALFGLIITAVDVFVTDLYKDRVSIALLGCWDYLDGLKSRGLWKTRFADILIGIASFVGVVCVILAALGFFFDDLIFYLRVRFGYIPAIDQLSF